MQQKVVGRTKEQHDPTGLSEGGPYVVFPTLDTYSWPSLGRSVSLKDAVAAMALGNAQILARYLRESEQPHRAVILTLATLLDSSPANVTDGSGTSTDILYDLWSSDFRIDWKLVFARPRRGKPKLRGLNVYWIGTRIEATLGTPPKVEAAIATLVEQTGVSRATAYRAWESYRSKMEAYTKAAKKEAQEVERLSESTREEDDLLKSCEELMKSFLAGKVSPKPD